MPRDPRVEKLQRLRNERAPRARPASTCSPLTRRGGNTRHEDRWLVYATSATTKRTQAATRAIQPATTPWGRASGARPPVTHEPNGYSVTLCGPRSLYTVW
jgi:hypothetical protein